jgi:hypothetical protein
VVAHQRVQAAFALVVGGVRFEHDARLLFEEASQRAGGGRVVLVHAAVVEVHARLHHRDHALPRIAQLRRVERLLVDGQGLRGGGRRGHLQAFGQRGFAAGNRHFGTDHVDRRRQAVFGGGAFGDLGQLGRTRGDDGIGSGTGSSAQDMLQSRWILWKPAAT